MTTPPVLIARLHAQSIDNFHTAPLLSIVRAYEISESGSRSGHVPNRVFTGTGSEHLTSSGVLFRARDTLYVHYRRDQVAAVVAAIDGRLRAAGYDRITFADTIAITGAKEN